MKISQFPIDNQRSKDWRIERLGVFTGSEISKLLVSGRKKEDVFGQTALDYIYEKMAERDLSSDTIGMPSIWDAYLSLTSSTSKAMQYGTDNEGDARRAFWVKFKEDNIFPIGDPYLGMSLHVTGSIPHFEIPCFASSPDGVIADAESNAIGCLEIKCPLPKTFVKYYSEINDGESLKRVNSDYYYQCQAHMMVTDTNWCCFAIYCPFLIHEIKYVKIRRDEEAIALITERLRLAEEYIKNCKDKNE